MTDQDLIAILRHYAALPDRACPAAVLVEAAARLTDGEIKRRPRRVRAEPEAQDVAFLPETQHDMQ